MDLDTYEPDDDEEALRPSIFSMIAVTSRDKPDESESSSLDTQRSDTTEYDTSYESKISWLGPTDSDTEESDTSSNPSESNGLSKPAVIAISICVPLVVLAIAALAFVFCYWRRRRQGMVDPVNVDNYQNMLSIDRAPPEAPGRTSQNSNHFVVERSAPHTIPDQPPVLSPVRVTMAQEDPSEMPPMYDEAVSIRQSHEAGYVPPIREKTPVVSPKSY